MRTRWKPCRSSAACHLRPYTPDFELPEKRDSHELAPCEREWREGRDHNDVRFPASELLLIPRGNVCSSIEVLEMKRSKPTTEFWTVLTMVNVLGLIYPIRLLLRANSIDENLFATGVLVGALFLLVVVDALSIVVGEAVGTGKR